MAIICPDCEGDGKIKGPIHVNRGDQPHEWLDEITCFRCKGEGRVSPDMLAWILRGKEARRIRIDQGVSIRQRAKAIGLSSADVSAMEHGRRDPSPLGV